MSNSIIPPPIVFDIDAPWGGVSIDRVRPGETGRCEHHGFHSFDEGMPFFKIVDNFSVLAEKAGVPPSMVDRMLVVMESKKCTVYVNQMLDYEVKFRAKRTIAPFEEMTRDDFAGIERICFKNIQIPKNANIILLLSDGWRKAFFFDFRPANKSLNYTIDYDLEVIGGQIVSHLMFTECFLLSEKDWDHVLDAGWFPFMFLVGEKWENLLYSIQHGEDIAVDEEKIYQSFREVIDARLDHWKQVSGFSADPILLDRVVKAYKEEDWITLISIACPRVEGIIRKSLTSFVRQKDLPLALKDSIEAGIPHEKSLLFPKLLELYFKKTFFGYVDFATDDKTLNRHSVAHGIVASESMDRSHGLKILLLIDHLSYCLP